MPATEADVRNWLKEMAQTGKLDLDANSPELAALALDMLARVPAPPPADALPAGNLTQHFTLAELTRSDTADAHGIANTPNNAEIMELMATAQLLELIRAELGGAPIIVSSGFRNAEVNRLVGGASNSAHRWGGAADFTAPKFGDPLAICRQIYPRLTAFGIDQLIYEQGGGAYWVHVGRAPPGNAPRAQAFTIVGGATAYVPFPNAA